MQKLLQRCREAARHAQNPRPLASQNEAGLCRLYEQRLPFYRQAELTVSARDKDAQQVAREIVAALGLSASAKQG